MRWALCGVVRCDAFDVEIIQTMNDDMRCPLWMFGGLRAEQDLSGL